jgi:hypothetical protein
MKHTNKILAAAAICLLPVLYVAAYLSLVQIEVPAMITGRGPWRCHPEYRAGGKAAEVFFQPAAAIDRQLRPEAWYVDLDPETMQIVPSAG